MSKEYEKNFSRPQPNVHFALSEKFGGPADADWVHGDNGYTVTQGGRTLGVHLSPEKIEKATAKFESGNERGAYFILQGPL